MSTELQTYQQLGDLPATITKNQFYRICHISKRHAKYLLDSGLVKCVDSGKKTRKYKIETKDVWAYLIDRELNPEKYRAPEGYYIANGGNLKRHIRRCQAPDSVVIFHFTDQEKSGLLTVWEAAAADYKDLMTTRKFQKRKTRTGKKKCFIRKRPSVFISTKANTDCTAHSVWE